MAMTPSKLKLFAQERFSKHQPVLSMWQDLAENFYPERANFVRQHNIGEELADNLATSLPILIRRELADSFEAMLRDGDWFKVRVDGEVDDAGTEWLQWASKRLLGFMRDRQSNFRRSTKEADNDYVTFGNAVMSVEINRKTNGLLYRTWDMKNVAWWDDEQGQVAGVVRKWDAKLHELESYFGEDKLHPKMKKMLKKSPFFEAMVYHFDIPSNMYDDSKFEQFERVSVFFDPTNDHIIEAVGVNDPQYIVPRFQTIAGSPYAYSPATVVGLPDARTLQAMTHTLLEAGERLARPPMIATENTIRGDANLYPDGITYVAEDYDERLGDSIRPLTQNGSGFPVGLELKEGIVDVLQSAFYTNKINLPETSREMTAYEVQERMKQYRRENLPLFAPIEHEYSGRLCELSFNLALNNGFLGSPKDIPQSLSGRNVEFKFESPLSAAAEELKASQMQQVSGLLREAAEFDQAAPLHVNFDEALRDSIKGLGVPQKWLNSLEDVDNNKQSMAEQQSEMAAIEQEQAQ